MSDSDLSEPVAALTPPDSELEGGLRKGVSWRLKNGGVNSIIPNAIRKDVEESLSLEAGFFVNHPKWKAESKRIILDEFEKRQTAPSSSAVTAENKTPPKKSPLPRSAHTSKPPKRSLPYDTSRTKKRRRILQASSEPEGDESSLLSDLTEEESAPKHKRKPTKTKPTVSAKVANGREKGAEAESDSVSSEVPKLPQKPSFERVNTPKTLESDASGSELSILLDEEPKPKGKKLKSSEAPERKAKKASAPKPKADAGHDSDETEVRRLQGWLVKCGIRKLWGKELKPYDTSKAKIKHLRDMLSEVGMTGRYSLEKANQIKESRELAADIEAVQEGAERWGRSNDGSEKEGEGRSKRRLVRGAKNYDFLSSDGEETD